MPFFKCLENLNGMDVNLESSMISKLSFDPTTSSATVLLKEDQSCEVMTNGKLAGCLPLGSSITIKASSNELKKKLGITSSKGIALTMK